MLSEQQTQTLEQLSAAATPGEWRTAFVHWGQWQIEAQGGNGDYKVNGEPVTPVVPYSNALVDDLNFICTLVNLYRTGQLVEVQADDATVERVARGLAMHMEGGVEYDYIPRNRLELRAWLSEGRVTSINVATQEDARNAAKAAIAAMKGPKL